MKTVAIKHDFAYLKGWSKENVLKEIGDGFNFYPDDTWTYVLDRKWWGKKTALLLKFNGEDQVNEVQIYTTLFKVRF
ncbi:hypothetical protein [Elizabethkingia anophelis]|uniref:hypothetical protein n=1 Tax=Elizabethkingia anophelis TaxID=1117645 RepID=UPI00136CB589|nr:hypothetical protein [Elizabethkingia anophelis]MYY27356.1 hypothetical protein [Elizabethkingia anophelis]